MQTDNRPHKSWSRYGVMGAVFGAGLTLGHLATARDMGAPQAPTVETILAVSRSVLDEPIYYPKKSPALITAKVVTLQPGQETSWHTHPIPTFGYILEGEIEVDYGAKGSKTYGQGQALMEAMAHAHQGRNVSTRPVRVLAVSMGAAGLPTSIGMKGSQQ